MLIDVAEIDDNGIIENVCVWEESEFEETYNLKRLTPGLWIGDTYTKEIPKDIASVIEANKIVDQVYANTTKLELLEMIAETLEKSESQGEI